MKRTVDTRHGRVPKGGPSHQTDADAVLVLDDDARIQEASSSLPKLLHLDAPAVSDTRFFEYVHPEHLNRVLWDLSEMTIRGRQEVTWLLRLKTGLGPWQWVKVEAVNHLTHPQNPAIVLHLYERGHNASAS